MSKKVPCHGCGKRCVTSEYNCHSVCPDYAEFHQDNITRAENIRKIKAEESAITELRLTALHRTSKKPRKDTPWKGRW